jgi:tetratricopeptide (TPR) repeat protein
METRFEQSRILLLASAAIVATVIAAYEPMRHNGFVYYDDSKYITENPVIKSGITRQSISQVFQPHYFMWHPLTTFTNMLDCELFGLNPFWHHSVSLLFHIINAILLLWLLIKLTGSTWASAFAAAVFALHPVQVESVAWASELKTVLSGLSSFLTIAVYIWYTKRPGIRRYIPLFLVYGLCIMTKPSVVVLPLALLLLDYWPLGRFDELKQVMRLLIEKVPLLGLSAFLGVMTVIAQKSGGTVATLAKVSMEYRIYNMFFSYIRYIGKTIWPSGLAVIYPLPHFNFLKTIAAVCVLLFFLITVVCIYTGLRRKYILTGWLWFVGTLVPMIGLIQVGSQSMANRYMYISILGLLFIGVWAIKDLIARHPQLKTITAVSAIAILLMLAILTRKQVGYYRSDMALFEYALKVTENNYIAENGYGFALSEAGRYAEALPHLSKAIQINPAYSDARNNLGVAFLKLGKTNEAIDCFNELIKRKEENAKVYIHLAAAMGIQKKYDEAIKCIDKAIELEPKNPDNNNKKGEILFAAGRTDEAISYLNEALRTDTGKAEIYALLGEAYKKSGKYEQAIESWNRAMELEPNNVKVLNNAAWLLATAGDFNSGNAAKATGFARHACELTGYKEPIPLDTLAAAYAAEGRFDDARRTAEKALAAAKAAKQQELAQRIESRLELYRQGIPYRQK